MVYFKIFFFEIVIKEKVKKAIKLDLKTLPNLLVINYVTKKKKIK